MASIILTRPDPDNGPWMQALTGLEQPVWAWPLIDIRPMTATESLASAWLAMAAHQVAMFVSRSAVQHFFALRPAASAWPVGTRAWCTGPGTRQALLAQGVPAQQIDLPSAQGAWDTEHLWLQVSDQVRPGVQVLLVRGTDADMPIRADEIDSGVGRDWLAEQIQNAGGQLTWAVAYQRACPVWDAQRLEAAAKTASDGSIWVFSSTQAVRHLKKLLPAQNWARARALATHERIAAQAKDMGFGHVVVCKPSAHDVLASLKSLS